MRFLPVLLLSSAAMLPAQQILKTFPTLDFIGWYTPMGDVDGDGYEDMFALAWIRVGPSPNQLDYELRLYSGRDGSLLRLGPRWAYPDGGFCYPTGDHDHDGVRDYICHDTDFTSPSPRRRLSVRSGRDDRVFWMQQATPTTYWVYHVLGDLDLNGDGELDVLVGHPVGGSSQGELWAYDHQGTLLYHLVGTGMVNSLAQSLAKLGDVNGDGCDDYLVGLGDPNWRGAVAVVSGIDGRFLRIVWGQNVGDYIGSGCTGCGDLDGDGLPDFAAGGGLSGSPGSVQAFSSATGARLFSVYSGLIGDRFGAVLRAADYDQDGVQDIIAATWAGMRVISGREGVQIAHYVPDSRASIGTFEAQPLFAPDGFPRLFVRSQVLGALLMSAMPHDSSRLGPGCAIGATQRAPMLGMRELLVPDAARGQRLCVSGAAPGSLALLLLGDGTRSPGPTSLAGIGLPQCAVYPDVAIVGVFATGSGGIATGYARHDFTIENPWLVGRAIDAQWLTVDPVSGPAGLSAGMRFVVWP